MSGNILGLVDCKSDAAADYNNVQELFVNLYRFFSGTMSASRAPGDEYCEIVALQCGFNTSSLDATDFWDESNPFDYANSWFVVRFPEHAGRTWEWYLMLQYCDADRTPNHEPENGTGAPAAYGLAWDLNDGVAIMYSAAVVIDGDKNPWNGTGSFGDNYKGTPVWKVPTSGTMVWSFPRANDQTGSYETNKEFIQTFTNAVAQTAGLTSPRYHMFADKDSFLFMLSHDDDGYIDRGLYFGKYFPKTGVTLDTPFCHIKALGPSDIASNTAYGSRDGTNWSGNDIAIIVPGGEGVRYGTIARLGEFYSINAQPADIYPTSSYVYEEIPLFVGPREPGGVQNHDEIIGIIDPRFIRETYNVVNHSTNLSGTRAVMGTSTQAAIKWSVPWSGTLGPPGTLSSRLGAEIELVVE